MDVESVVHHLAAGGSKSIRVDFIMKYEVRKIIDDSDVETISEEEEKPINPALKRGRKVYPSNTDTHCRSLPILFWRKWRPGKLIGSLPTYLNLSDIPNVARKHALTSITTVSSSTVASTIVYHLMTSYCGMTLSNSIKRR